MALTESGVAAMEKSLLMICGLELQPSFDGEGGRMQFPYRVSKRQVKLLPREFGREGQEVGVKWP